MFLQVSLHGMISVTFDRPLPGSSFLNRVGITAPSVLMNYLKVEIVGLHLKAEASRAK